MRPNGITDSSAGGPKDHSPGIPPAPIPKGEVLAEFLNPKSMITPGLAGALTMAIANTVYSNFGIQRPLVGIVVAALFAVLAVGVAVIPLWQKIVYFLLNTLVIFSVGLGANSAGETVVGTSKQAYPFGAFKETGSLSLFTSEAFAQENIDGVLVKGSESPVYIVIGEQRRAIPNDQTLSALGLTRVAIKHLDDGRLNAIPRGPDYPALPGPVVKGSGPDVYLLQDGYKRMVPDPQTFEANGLKWESIRVIPDQALQSIPEGPAIPKERKFFAPWFSK